MFGEGKELCIYCSYLLENQPERLDASGFDWAVRNSSGEALKRTLFFQLNGKRTSECAKRTSCSCVLTSDHLSRMRKPVSVERQLAVTLHYLSDEGRLRKIANTFGIARYTVFHNNS